jgi:hypothetical protein
VVIGFSLLASKEWNEFCRSGEKPSDIPRNPYQYYQNKGWKGWHDFLGIPLGVKKKNKKYLDYNFAKEKVVKLNINTQAKWFEYCKSGMKQADIPRNPNVFYQDEWEGRGLWLGTGRKATKDRVFWGFKEAKSYVQNLKLKSEGEWRIYTKSEKMNINIPVSPGTVYKNSGWISMGDWLGTGFVANRLKEFLSFGNAKKMVVKLRLKGLKDWKQYCNSGEKPNNIPSKPHRIYINTGWAGYGDWLGTGNVSAGSLTYMDFVEARKFVRELKLNSKKEWDVFCNSGNKPNNIPGTPHHVYKSKGWIGMGDWLGKLK